MYSSISDYIIASFVIAFSDISNIPERKSLVESLMVFIPNPKEILFAQTAKRFSKFYLILVIFIILLSFLIFFWWM